MSIVDAMKDYIFDLGKIDSKNPKKLTPFEKSLESMKAQRIINKQKIALVSDLTLNNKPDLGVSSKAYLMIDIFYGFSLFHIVSMY